MADYEKQGTVTRHIDTGPAYDRWARVYDTDGNFLQALDTLEMSLLLPKAVSLVDASKPWRLVDLGCGTGRNTVNLLDVPDTQIVGLDLSRNMLEIARERLVSKASSLGLAPNFRLEQFDMLEWDSTSEIPTGGQADLMVSTLVLEHIPLATYFRTVAAFLKEGGLLVLTNMHSEMGHISQAGFRDPETGEKIRPTSYAHTVEETIAESAKFGLEVVESFKEIAVDEENCSALGPRARKWIGIKVWYGGILRKGNSGAWP